MSFIDSLSWRYATKKFDPDKKVSEETLQQLLEAIRLSPSSYGLQPLKIMVVEDQAIRQKLREAAFGQPQITDASQLLVFCAKKEYKETDLNSFIEAKARAKGISAENMAGYKSFLQNNIQAKSPAALLEWNSRQAYLALGVFLAACSAHQVDSCPMEGFDPDQFDTLLDLPSKGLRATVLATIGYRAAEDETQHLPKVRKPFKDLFEMI